MPRNLDRIYPMRIAESVQHPTALTEASLEYVLAVDARLVAGDTAKDIAEMSARLAELQKEADERAHEVAAQSAHDGQGGFFHEVAGFLTGADSGAQETSTVNLAFEHLASPGGSGDAETDVQTNREFNSLFLRMVDSVAAYDSQQHLTTAAISDQHHVLSIEGEGSHATFDGTGDLGSIFDAMIEYQKLMNKEAREDHKIAQAEHAAELTSHSDKLDHETTSIADQQHEAHEKYDSARHNADAELWTGVASGALQVGENAGENASASLQAELDKPVNDLKEIMSEMARLHQNEDDTKDGIEDQKDHHSAATDNLDHAAEQYEQMLNSIGGQDSGASSGSADHGAPTPARDSNVVSTSEMFDGMERSIEIAFNKLEQDSHDQKDELSDKIDQLAAAHEAEHLTVPADQPTTAPSDSHDDAGAHPHFELAAMMTDTGHHWPL
jgi:hypothetical protein